MTNSNDSVAQIYDDIKKWAPSTSTRTCENENDAEFFFRRSKILTLNPFLIPMEVRDMFIEKFCWSIVTKETIKEMVDFIKDDIALEIGAGTGLYAYLLRNCGVQIIPTDVVQKRNSFLKIVQCEAVEAVNKFSAEILITIWPPCWSLMAYNSLKAFQGNKIIYIGEECGGCTGDDQFHELLRKEWRLVNKIQIPNWPMIRDFVWFYERNIK